MTSRIRSRFPCLPPLAAAGIVLLAAASVRGQPAVDAAAVRARVKAVDAAGACVIDAAGVVREIVIPDGSAVTADDVAFFGTIGGLKTLRIANCRSLNDEMVASLRGLGELEALSLTNTALTDAGVEAIADAFPGLVDLDLSSNTNLTGGAMRSIAGLTKLRKLALVQTRFNDLNTRRLAKLVELRSLDLRGCMEAGDMTLAMAGGLPHLAALKHRSSVVTDEGIAKLTASRTLESLLAQDFAITSAAGTHLAGLPTLTSLEVFRCQGFGTAGVLALAGTKLDRLTLRDLPEVGDGALAVLRDLPRLRRLCRRAPHHPPRRVRGGRAAARGLQVLDIWSLPRMTDATVARIAALPELTELSIRETGVTEAALPMILGIPGLESLTFKNNGSLSAETAARVKAARTWRKLDLGS